MGAHLQAVPLLVLCNIPRGMLTLSKHKGQINSAIALNNAGGKERDPGTGAGSDTAAPGRSSAG